MNLRWFILYGGVTDFNFQNKLCFRLKIIFVLTNSAYVDEMLHHLGLHCVPKYLFSEGLSFQDYYWIQGFEAG